MPGLHTLAFLKRGGGGYEGGTFLDLALLAAKRGPAPKKIERKIFWFQGEERNKKERDRRVSNSN